MLRNLSLNHMSVKWERRKNNHCLYVLFQNSSCCFVRVLLCSYSRRNFYKLVTKTYLQDQATYIANSVFFFMDICGP